MKRLLLFPAFVLGMGATLNAQNYYWQVDGTTATDVLQRAEVSMVGATTPMTVQGHIFSGTKNSASYNLMATAMDEDGVSGTIYFQNEYDIYDASNITQYPSDKCLIVEGPNDGTYAPAYYSYCMVGDLAQGVGMSAIYYVPLEHDGLPTITGTPNGFMYFNNPYWQLDVRDAEYVDANKMLYILAQARYLSSSTFYYQLILLAIDPYSGIIVWDGIYGMSPAKNMNEPHKIAYNPGNDELIVAGHYVDVSSGEIDAYLFHTDASAGGPGTFELYGSVGSADRFWGLTVANPGNSWGGGVVGVGISDINGNEDIWAAHVPPTYGTADWTMTYDNFNNSGQNDFGVDVVERLNGSSAYEYFLGGSTVDGANGGADMEIVKVDDLGAVVTGANYGNANDDFGVWIDQDPAANSPGVSIYGIQVTGFHGNWDISQFKNYYNLYNNCNDIIGTPSSNSGPDYITSQDASLETEQHDDNRITLVVGSTTSSYQYCYGVDVNGDNSRLANAHNMELATASIADGILVELEVFEPGAVTLMVSSIAGQVLQTHRVNTHQGTNIFTLDQNNLSSGIYLVTAGNGSRIATQKVVIR